MAKFHHPTLAELTHQLTLSPRRLRVEQVHGIDRLLGVVEPSRSYPFEFVCFHITKYQKRGTGQGSNLSGKTLIGDLVTMAEVISRRANLAAAELGESLETHAELAKRLQVSTKTIRRWRGRGLMGVRVVFEDGVNRLAFCTSSVNRFVERNRTLVEKGAAFRQLTAAERESIVERARQLVAETPLKLHAAARQIAQESGRAVETVRYTLRRYDATPGSVPLFRRVAGAGRCERWTAMVRCHEAGESIPAIAHAFSCGEDEVVRTLRRVQIEKWSETPIEYVPHELFDAPNAEDLILGVPEPMGKTTEGPRPPRDLPSYLRHLYETPLLTADQEQDLFRRYNYVKYRMAKVLKSVAKRDPSEEEFTALREDFSRIDEFRRRIIRANLRLVVSIAKRHAGWSDSFYEVVSDGNMSLMRAVEKFDFARGNKFSTYATWAIMKNYARSIPEDRSRLRRFVTGQERVLEDTPETNVTDLSADSDRRRVKELLSAGLEQLDARERVVLTNHFGLNRESGSLTLEQIGREIGVTKERVRQIEKQAIARLREVLPPGLVDCLRD
jgi:RNA polymerase primary sigma factor